MSKQEEKKEPMKLNPINYATFKMDEIHPEARRIAVAWMEGWEEWMKTDIRHKVKLASDIMNFAIAYAKPQKPSPVTEGGEKKSKEEILREALESVEARSMDLRYIKPILEAMQSYADQGEGRELKLIQKEIENRIGNHNGLKNNYTTGKDFAYNEVLEIIKAHT